MGNEMAPSAGVSSRLHCAHKRNGVFLLLDYFSMMLERVARPTRNAEALIRGHCPIKTFICR